jgi:hypothetical protein
VRNVTIADQDRSLVDLAATQTDNLLDPSQLEDLIKEDLLFRDRQLKRLKDEILYLEDFDDTVSLTDFSLANRACPPSSKENFHQPVNFRTPSAARCRSQRRNAEPYPIASTNEPPSPTR